MLNIKNNIFQAILAMKFKMRKPIMKNSAQPILENQFSPPIPKEPATKDNKLFELENTVFSPHCSANTVEASIKMGKLAVENAYTILSGLPCKYAVN